MVDSGATYTQFPNSLYKWFEIYFSSFIKEIDKYCDENNENCKAVKVDIEDYYCIETFDDNITAIFSYFPVIYITISNEIIDWKPADYFIKDYNYKNLYCIGIDKQTYDNVNNISYIILGMTFLVKRQAIFDFHN